MKHLVQIIVLSSVLVSCQYVTETKKEVAVKSYSEDIRVFTAQELRELKYTRQVIITDGPFDGRTCRIKSIEGKSRIIVELLEGSFALPFPDNCDSIQSIMR